jgi:hypothetical protein
MLASSIRAGDVLVETGGITILIVHIEELPEFMKSILGTHHIWWMGLSGFVNLDNQFTVDGPWVCGPKITNWKKRKE